MKNLRLGAILAGVTVMTFATPAFAIGSEADCEYEGGSVFDLPTGDQVCLVQIREEAYRNDPTYDGQQLGVSECTGDVISNGLFCKITLREAPKVQTSAPVQTEATDVTVVLNDAAPVDTVSETKTEDN